MCLLPRVSQGHHVNVNPVFARCTSRAPPTTSRVVGAVASVLVLVTPFARQSTNPPWEPRHRFDPKERISASDALKHPYFEDLSGYLKLLPNSTCPLHTHCGTCGLVSSTRLHHNGVRECWAPYAAACVYFCPADKSIFSVPKLQFMVDSTRGTAGKFVFCEPPAFPRGLRNPKAGQRVRGATPRRADAPLVACPLVL